MELIDTHCHLTFTPLDADLEAVLERSRDNLYATVGVHHHDAKEVCSDTLTQLKQLAENVNVVAIGETGLDFHYNFSKQGDQIRVFAAQLKLAE